MSDGTPPAEFEVTAELAHALLANQHPDLVGQAITPLAHGWDNALFRLGEDLILRLPRRQLGADFIEKEQYWLPLLAPHLPIAIPAPIRTGGPEGDYPWPWSVTPYFEGEILGEDSLSPAQASAMIGFLHSLHQHNPTGAPENEYRGGPLADKQEQVEARFELLRELDFPWPNIRRAWHAALAEPFPGRTGWIHGDLHARNLLVNLCQLAAVLDWGDVCIGDLATDYAVFLLGDSPELAFAEFGADDSATKRALGWAIHFALMYAEAGEQGDRVFRVSGDRILRNVARMAG